MKLRNYEKKSIVVFFITILLFGILGLAIFTCFYKIPTYRVITGVVFKDDLIEVMVTDSELKQMYKNSMFYIDDKKYNYSIEEVILKALVKDHENYNVVYIGCLIDDRKENDVVELVFRNEKVKLFKMFEVIWG